jgi:hypothetical protein
LIFNGLRGFISQKIELFITTAVRTSNPTMNKRVHIEDWGVNGRMLKLMLKRQRWNVWTGFIWSRIGTSIGLL